MKENLHHILYQRKKWQDTPEGACLRETNGLVVPMDIQIHQELHNELWEGVPLLGSTAIRQVMTEMNHSTKYLDVIDNVMCLIDKSRDPLTDLALCAIENQLPFIKEGITRQRISNKRRRRSNYRVLSTLV